MLLAYALEPFVIVFVRCRLPRTVAGFVLLAAGDGLRRKFVAFAGSHFERRRITRDVIRAIDRQIERYLVARALISLIVAVATAAGM